MREENERNKRRHGNRGERKQPPSGAEGSSGLGNKSVPPAPKPKNAPLRAKGVAAKVSSPDVSNQKDPQTVALSFEISNSVKAVVNCKKHMAQIRESFCEERGRCLVQAYAIARKLSENEDDWRAFTQFKFWKNRTKELKIKDALRHVVLYACGARHGTPRYKTATKYARALRGMWDNQAPAKSVEAEIEKAGGIEKLASAQSCKKQKGAVQTKPLLAPKESKWLAKGLSRRKKGVYMWILLERLDNDEQSIAKFVKARSANRK